MNDVPVILTTLNVGAEEWQPRGLDVADQVGMLLAEWAFTGTKHHSIGDSTSRLGKALA
jgi:hypothetical protein